MTLPLRFLARQSAREIRALAGKGALFVACLAIGVAATVAVAGLADSIEASLSAKARELLAADVAASSRQPLPPRVMDAARALPGARLAEVVELFSMAAADGAASDPASDVPRSRLCEIKAAATGWPFHGRVVTDPPDAWNRGLGDSEALVAPSLGRALGLTPGGVLRLGEASFTVRGFVIEEPDGAVGRVALAPRVLLTRAGADRTGLLGAGSRQLRKILVALPDGADVEAAAATLREAAGGSPFVTVESHRQAQPELRGAIARAERFLALVALLSLIIGGAGIAEASRAWLASRVDSIALLRCLGLRPLDVLALDLALASALGLLGAVLGVALGFLALSAAPALLAGLLENVTVTPWQPIAAAEGLLLGLLTALAFSLPTLLAIVRVPALRALRSSAEPPPASRAARAGLIAALAGFGWIAASARAGSAGRGAIFVAALAATGLALALAARGATRLLARVRPSSGLAWLRLALGAAARPGSGVASATVALGLGVLVVTSVSLVQDGLRRELMASLPDAAPSAFILDIQPQQWPKVEELLRREGATNILSTPMLSARLRSIDGRSTRELAGNGAGAASEGRGAWALTREQRLTWQRELPADNRVVAGALWSDPERAELSVEEDFAKDLGLALGSRVELDIQGVPVELWVTSLRRVEWRTFRINFFLVAEPGVLEDAPHVILAAARLPEGREDHAQDELVALAPNVTVIPVRDALARAAGLVTRLADGVSAVGAFSVVAGLAILAGAVAAGAARRGTELALLKTLGMTRREAVAMLLVEHAALGLVAGLIGALGGALIAGFILVRVMELPWRPDPAAIALAVGLTMALTAASGTLTCLRALTRRPVEALRAE